MRLTALALPLALLCALVLGGCSCSGPSPVSLSEIEKTALKGHKSPIDVSVYGEFNSNVKDIMVENGFSPVFKTLPAQTLANGDTVNTEQAIYWNAVKLDGESVPPEHRGKTAHFIYEQIRTTNKTRSGLNHVYTQAYRWELPAKE